MPSTSQYGFRPNYSKYMPLLNLDDTISSNMESNKFTIGIFMDLAKSFDVIDHNILRSKLNYDGVKGVSHKWFTSFLTYRMQFTQTNLITS